MARYLVERTFPNGLEVPLTEEGARTLHGIVETNAACRVTWIHSYVSADRMKTFCIYDGPDPETIRRVAEQNRHPVDRITQVSVLDPYFYR
jgi:hypothetical protein